jgi:hypothetical protein
VRGISHGQSRRRPRRWTRLGYARDLKTVFPLSRERNSRLRGIRPFRLDLRSDRPHHRPPDRILHETTSRSITPSPTTTTPTTTSPSSAALRNTKFHGIFI